MRKGVMFHDYHFLQDISQADSQTKERFDEMFPTHIFCLDALILIIYPLLSV